MRQYSSFNAMPPPRSAAGLWSGVAALLLAAGLTVASASAQGGQIIIRDATVLVGDGKTLENASVSIRGDKIGAVGTNVRGRAATTIDGKGKFVTPGLIDAWCTLASDPGEQARTASAVALDAFNRFEHEQLTAALQQGVTSAFLPARALSGVGGLGSVVRITPAATEKERVLLEDAALCAGLGLDPRMSVIARARAAGEFRKAWLDARQYRKAFETYEEDLKEYEEKIKKRAEEQKDRPKDDKAGEKKEEKKDEKPEEPVREPEPPRPDRPRPDRPRPGRRPPTQRPETRPEARPSAEAEKRDEKKDDIKKPAEPQKDPTKEALLRAIDGKLAVRVEAHRPEDIQNALAIANEFNLALAIDGGSGAVPVAPELARAKVPVILAADPPNMQYSPGLMRYAQADAAARLLKGGVKVLLGSGPGTGDSPARHLVLAAARVVGAGIHDGRALQMITGDAAEVLGVADQIGRVAPGLSADVVVWSDHPFSPGAQVERVFIRGREVYSAVDSKPAASEPADPEPGSEQTAEQKEGER